MPDATHILQAKAEKLAAELWQMVNGRCPISLIAFYGNEVRADGNAYGMAQAAVDALTRAAQALADAEARGAAEAEGRLKRLESALAFLDDHAMLIDPRDEDKVYEPSRAPELAIELGWTPEKGGEGG